MGYEQDTLDKWSAKEGMTGVIFQGYRDCGKYAGFCHGRNYGTPQITMMIEVDSHYEKHRFVCKGILWHEFIHAYTFWHTGTMGHRKNWLKMYVKKPHLVLAGFLAPFVRW